KFALEAFIAGKGIELRTSPLVDICGACLDFYAQVRVDGTVPLDEDGDMFLFQWGRSQYDKRPGDFHVDFVRQFGVPATDDEDSQGDMCPPYEDVDYYQLHCTIWMPARPFSSIANGHCWLYRPAQAADFRTSMTSHPVLVQARDHQQTASEIAIEKV
ncbi:MAG TPA: hypothetical protein VJV39_23200, partial [Dongiaceae bacterium]|nr:hypothetical protein [Dongiaceae bacterium]